MAGPPMPTARCASVWNPRSCWRKVASCSCADLEQPSCDSARMRGCACGRPWVTGRSTFRRSHPPRRACPSNLHPAPASSRSRSRTPPWSWTSPPPGGSGSPAQRPGWWPAARTRTLARRFPSPAGPSCTRPRTGPPRGWIRCGCNWRRSTIDIPTIDAPAWPASRPAGGPCSRAAPSYRPRWGPASVARDRKTKPPPRSSMPSAGRAIQRSRSIKRLAALPRSGSGRMCVAPRSPGRRSSPPACRMA